MVGMPTVVQNVHTTPRLLDRMEDFQHFKRHRVMSEKLLGPDNKSMPFDSLIVYGERMPKKLSRK